MNIGKALGSVYCDSVNAWRHSNAMLLFCSMNIYRQLSLLVVLLGVIGMAFAMEFLSGSAKRQPARGKDSLTAVSAVAKTEEPPVPAETLNLKTGSELPEQTTNR